MAQRSSLNFLEVTSSIHNPVLFYFVVALVRYVTKLQISYKIRSEIEKRYFLNYPIKMKTYNVMHEFITFQKLQLKLSSIAALTCGLNSDNQFQCCGAHNLQCIIISYCANISFGFSMNQAMCTDMSLYLVTSIN